MMPDIESLIPHDVRSVAIVGVAKNCGKTTTFQAILDNLDRSERLPGLVSIGLDGEPTDLLLGTDKPSITPRRGDWIVTAQGALNRSGVRLDFAESLDIHTPLGEVVVGEVVEAGDVILAGLRHRTDLTRAIERLEANGAALILIDGAYGRVSAARPRISDGVIVSTGAVLDSDVEAIVERTASLVERLQLPGVDHQWQADLAARARRDDRVLLGGPDREPVELSERSALIALRRAGEAWSDDVEAVAVPGVVSDGVVEALLSAPTEAGLLIVQDATAIQVDDRALARFRRDWSIRVEHTIRLLGISYNPTSPRGRDVDETRLRDVLAARWPQLPLFDSLASE